MPRIALIAVLLAFSGAAQACGYCVEDKIAAAYDHAVVSRALGEKHHVAFFHVEGMLPAGAGAARALESLAETAAGVDRGSARVSLETATLAVAFDPRHVRFGALQAALDRKLAARKLSLFPLRVMERPAEMKLAKPEVK